MMMRFRTSLNNLWRHPRSRGSKKQTKKITISHLIGNIYLLLRESEFLFFLIRLLTKFWPQKTNPYTLTDRFGPWLFPNLLLAVSLTARPFTNSQLYGYWLGHPSPLSAHLFSTNQKEGTPWEVFGDQFFF